MCAYIPGTPFDPFARLGKIEDSLFFEESASSSIRDSLVVLRVASVFNVEEKRATKANNDDVI